MTQYWRGCRHSRGPGGCYCGGRVADRKWPHHELRSRQHTGMAFPLACMRLHVHAYALRNLMGIRLPACDLSASTQDQPCEPCLQALYQLAGLASTLVIAMAGGAAAATLVKYSDCTGQVTIKCDEAGLPVQQIAPEVVAGQTLPKGTGQPAAWQGPAQVTG